MVKAKYVVSVLAMALIAIGILHDSAHVVASGCAIGVLVILDDIRRTW